MARKRTKAAPKRANGVRAVPGRAGRAVAAYIPWVTVVNPDNDVEYDVELVNHMAMAFAVDSLYRDGYVIAINPDRSEPKVPPQN